MKNRTLLSNLLGPHYKILTNAGSLVGTTAVSSLLGFAYWWLAARQFLPQEVGIASAAVSTMVLLATVALLGFGTLLMGELSRNPDTVPTLISTALTVATVTGTGLGLLFAVAAPHILKDLSPIGSNPATVLLFASGVGLTALGLVLDQAVLGLLLGHLQFWRNVTFSVAKLACLFAAGLWFTEKIWWVLYLAWAIGNLISLLLLMVMHRASGHGYVGLAAYRPRWNILRALARSALGHHGLNLALQAPLLALPVVVTSTLRATTNAYFYVAWMIASLVFAVPVALTTTLYAANAADTSTLAHRMRITLLISLLLGLAANLVLYVAGGPILSLFGQQYASQATLSLHILSLGVFPLILKYHYIAVRRIYSEITSAARLVAAGGLLELGLGVAGGLSGELSMLCIGWLIALSVEAAVMTPAVFRAATRPEQALAEKVETPTPEGKVDEIFIAR